MIAFFQPHFFGLPRGNRCVTIQPLDQGLQFELSVRGSMLDPVAIHEIAGAALLGGAIILFGAGYALFLALSRLNGSVLFSRISLVCYAALAASAGGLTVLLNLWGWWLALVCALLAGYFVAPRFIWRLSEAVHGGASAAESEGHGG